MKQYIYLYNLTLYHAATVFLNTPLCSNQSLIVPLAHSPLHQPFRSLLSTSYRSPYYFPTDWSLLQGMRPLITIGPVLHYTNTTVYRSALWVSKTRAYFHKHLHKRNRLSIGTLDLRNRRPSSQVLSCTIPHSRACFISPSSDEPPAHSRSTSSAGRRL